MSQVKTAGAKCPVHVGEVDLFAAGAQEYWFEAYRLLQDEAPVFRIPDGAGKPGVDAFILTKYEDISRVVRDSKRFTTGMDSGFQEHEIEVFAERGFGDVATAAQTLRPTIAEHMQHRRQLTDPWVGATGAPQHEEMTVQVANELMDRWVDDGEVEFVKGFAAPMPQNVITRILGFPLEDMPMLKGWEEAQVRRFVYGDSHLSLLNPEQERENAEALVDFQQYIQGKIDEKRKTPQHDMTTFLTQVEYGDDKRPLTDGEIINVVYTMHIGGNETTQYALTSEAMLLAQNPHVFAELKADRTKVKFFVEEALRLFAPTQGMSSRMVQEDVEIRGTQIPKGSLLHVRYGAGNRDQDNFPDAEKINLNRPNAGRHLTFSQGARNCPGAGLSRLEQNTVVNMLLDRLDTLELAPGKNDFTH